MAKWPSAIGLHSREQPTGTGEGCTLFSLRKLPSHSSQTSSYIFPDLNLFKRPPDVRKAGSPVLFPGTICLKTKQNKSRVLLLRRERRPDLGSQLAASTLSPRGNFLHREVLENRKRIIVLPCSKSSNGFPLQSEENPKSSFCPIILYVNRPLTIL